MTTLFLLICVLAAVASARFVVAWVRARVGFATAWQLPEASQARIMIVAVAIGVIVVPEKIGDGLLAIGVTYGVCLIGALAHLALTWQADRLYRAGWIPRWDGISPGSQSPGYQSRPSAQECERLMSAGLTPVPDGWTYGDLNERECERLLRFGYLPHPEGGWAHSDDPDDRDSWRGVVATT